MSIIEGESRIVFGFPGTGKTYAFEHAEELGLDIVDSDSSNFHWLKDDNGNNVLDVFGERIVHPEWPQNYAKYIELIGREQYKKPDYILVSTHEEVMKEVLLLDFDICFTVVPDASLKEKYMQIYKDRGNDEEFISTMDKNWDKFVSSATRLSTTMDFVNNMLVLIREGGKIQHISDLLKLKIALPMEFDKKENYNENH